MKKFTYLMGASAAMLLPAVSFAEETAHAAAEGRPTYALAKGFAV